MLPQEFLERMENMLGEEYPAFLKSYDIARYQALRLNPQKGDDVSFLNRGVFSLERVPWAEHGYYYTAKDTPGKHPYHEAGVYYIQEPSAMAPAAYLTRQRKTARASGFLICARHREEKAHRLRRRWRAGEPSSAMKSIRRGQRFSRRISSAWELPMRW